MKSKLFVIFSFSLALGIVAYFLGGAFVRREAARKELEIRELPRDANQGLVEVEPVEVDSVEVPLPLSEEAKSASYTFGYERGYRAFMEQQGQVVKVASYTSSLDESELDADQASKGYVDGYHKAGDSFYCPRSEYR